MGSGGRIGAALLGLLLVAAAGSAAGGEEVTVAFGGSRVTLTADAVSVHAILAAWARVGQTQFVDVEHLGEEPVTLQLIAVPETEALRILLRKASGFVAAPRAQATDDVSSFARVMIMRPSRSRPVPWPAAPGDFSGDGAALHQEIDSEAVGWGFPNMQSNDRVEDEFDERLPEPLDPLFAEPADENNEPLLPGPPVAPRPGMLINTGEDQTPVFRRP